MTNIKNEVLLIIPTYNERDNIDRLLDEIESVSDNKFDVLFVDDNSPDGTGSLIDEIKAKRSNVFVIHRKGKMGLGSAYLEGFRYGIEIGYEYMFEMDADLSHPPHYLKDMIDKLKGNDDVVVGSRFMSGIGNINKTPLRVFISIIAARYMQFILKLECSDPMGGFAGYRTEAIKGIDFRNFHAKGYGFQVEMKYACKVKGLKIAEIPIIFKNRNSGDSKISKRDIVEALALPWRIRSVK